MMNTEVIIALVSIITTIIAYLIYQNKLLWKRVLKLEKKLLDCYEHQKKGGENEQEN